MNGLKDKNGLVLVEPVTEFDFDSTIVENGGQITIPDHCNAILCVNIGGVGAGVITVNNYPLNPALVAGQNGESWSIGGNRNEIISRKVLDVTFAAASRLFIQFKIYNCR